MPVQPMPTDVAMIVAGVVLVFTLFGSVLLFADLSTAHLRRKRSAPAE